MHDHLCIKELDCQQSNLVVALHHDQVTHTSGKIFFSPYNTFWIFFFEKTKEQFWINFQTVFTVVACDADPDAYYYYGGPGYYHGYYSSGFKKYPSFYFNQRKRRDAMYQHQSQTYVSLLKPYR